MAPHMHNNPLIERVLELNAARVVAHREEKSTREKFIADNPVHYIVIGCMDGRASHLPQALGIPVGCCEHFQTAGALFSTSWPYFGHLLSDSVGYGIKKNRTIVIFVASHYSKKYPDHGCRAFLNDRDKAREHILHLSERIRWNFEEYNATIHVLPIELNTDDDSIIMHGDENMGQIDTSHFVKEDTGLEQVLSDMFGSFVYASRSFEALVSIVRNNIAHVQTIHRNPRTHQDCCHGESVLFVGRGAGTWLNPHRNMGIILFPEGEQLDLHLRDAGSILSQNMKTHELLKEHGILVMPCATYTDPKKRHRSIDRVTGYTARVERVLAQYHPTVTLTLFPGTVNLKTWEFTPIT